MTLQAILYHSSPAGSPSEPATLQILDQLLLPHSTTYISLTNTQDAFHAIKSMRVRGAPAIAIVAALSLAVELSNLQSTGRLSPRGDEAAFFIAEKLDYLLESRPTAVNLGDAVGKLKAVVEGKVRGEVIAEPGKTLVVKSKTVLEAYITAAERMLQDDIRDNEAIGYHGKEWILKHATKGADGKVSVLTHCNTGSLATSGHGTALGVIRTLHSEKLLRRAFFTETRPYNQGSRLTAYELLHDSIPSTLITDSMAASLLSLRGGRDEDNIVAVVVGADRVARNGDTANKIGTYALAILARHHGKKFLVAAPRTTIDLKTSNGDSIVIEERPGDEVTKVKGPRCDDVDEASVRGDGTGETVTISIAAKGVAVWNPAFDVTPAALIDGIITERGVMEKNAEGEFELSSLFV